MTFTQILVLVVVVCVSAVQCVSMLVKASVMRQRIGVPNDNEVSRNVLGALMEADKTGAMVTIRFGESGTEIVYIPQGTEDEPVQVGD